MPPSSGSAVSHRVVDGPEGIRLVLPGFGAPHAFGTKGFPRGGAGVLDGAVVVTAKQVHTDTVLAVDEAPAGWRAYRAYAATVEADALATDRPGVWVGVYTADCAPVLLHDPVRGAVAAVHAGWRGAVLGVVPAAIRALKERFGAEPSRLEAAIGPHIGACCFEVGAAVFDALAARYDDWERWITRSSGKTGYLDLRELVRWQLETAGVHPSRLSGVDLCTRCETGLLSSYRREGRRPAGMISAIRVPADGLV